MKDGKKIQNQSSKVSFTEEIKVDNVFGLKMHPVGRSLLRAHLATLIALPKEDEGVAVAVAAAEFTRTCAILRPLLQVHKGTRFVRAYTATTTPFLHIHESSVWCFWVTHRKLNNLILTESRSRRAWVHRRNRCT